MVLTEFQRHVCRLIAEHRIESGESYLAGGATLNELISAPRISRDLDLFHDTGQALEWSWDADRRLLSDNGFGISVVRERSSFVEAEVWRDDDRVLMQWARDAAYRFFPLVQHDELGLVLHPFDLATNKVLALVGRLEVRDWIDVIECGRRLQPLGYLCWAASGKDPGFSPASILEHAGRSSRYSVEEVGALSFAGQAPDAAALANEWRRMMEEGLEVVAALPAKHVGTCVLDSDRALFRGDLADLTRCLRRCQITFHTGAIRGTLPSPVIEPGS